MLYSHFDQACPFTEMVSFTVLHTSIGIPNQTLLDYGMCIA
jgi:hypothetical protein